MSRVLPLGARSFNTIERPIRDIAGLDGWFGIDKAALALILAKEFLLDYLGAGLIANLVICGYIFVRLVLSKQGLPYFAYALVGTMCLLFGVGSILAGDTITAAKNLLRIAQVFLYAMFCFFLLQNYGNKFQSLFRKSAFFFNSVLVINICVIVLQFWFPGSFVAYPGDTTLTLEDTMSGLFGSASTHAIAIYTTFVIIYDYVVFRRDKRGVQYWLYLIAIAIVSLWIATLNDNKALFFFLPVGLLLCLVMYCCVRPRVARRILLPYAVGAIVLIAVLYSALPFFREYLEQNIFKSIEIATRAFDLNAYVNGSDERFKLIVYALSLPGTWLMGDGFGLVNLYQEGYRGFNHFGLSDFGSIAILGGIWFYIVVLYAFSRPFGDFKKENAPLVFSVVSLFALLAFYTQVFTQVRIAIPAFMLAITFCCLWRDLTVSTSGQGNLTDGR